MMKLVYSLFLTICVACSVHAQKFGHINTSALLEAMPEVKTADQLLAAFQEGLIKGGETKAATFEADYKKYLEDVNNGVLSKVQQADRENALAKAQQEIQQYEQQVQLQVLQKREELLKPILQKVDEAIKAEGKEGGYLFIFDSSVSGALLFAQESDDLLSAVKKRLGIQ
ncbi:MAG TPA: OmpH family outer membrane protein [Saprospiraceae bacterium]|nr:OmpH family outer membrane protein [Saprospiraceae bacterium]